MIKYVAVLLLIFSINFAYAEIPNTILVGAFSTGQIDAWQHKEFKGRTRYKIIQIDNKKVLKAESNASASGLFKEQRINLQDTPYLNWSWRIENRLGDLNEQKKSGDDYAARIYVVISGGVLFWNTRAINYVWSANTEKGKTWPNAFVGDNAIMIAIRSSEDATGTWFTEKRNVLYDLKQLYGKEYQYIDAIAVMTDTDNAKGKATAYYGDIYFSNR
jgi:hypothetical protein